MIVTIQPRSIINVYLRRSTKIVQDSSSLCLLNFCRKNSSNLDAAIKSFSPALAKLNRLPFLCRGLPHNCFINICIVA